MQKRISVRDIVEFILRSGSIDSGLTGRNRLEEGSRVHRKLQKAEGYQAEVHLAITETHGGVDITVEGRADGVIITEEGVTIDEIKTTLTPLELIHNDYDSLFGSIREITATADPMQCLGRQHWYQAMCYGYIYCVKNSLERIDIRLTYYEMETGSIRRFARTFTATDLCDFFSGLLEMYAVWVRYESGWQETSSASMQSLAFPYDAYREGQRKLAAAVYKTITASGRLFAMAPTGVGKTISTLFPALKAVGEGNGEKIFYLTARTVTRQAAGAALDKMRERGLCVKSVTITAKDKICFQMQELGTVDTGGRFSCADSSAQENRPPVLNRPSVSKPSGHICKPGYCEYANGHYDRINDAIMDVLRSCDAITAETAADFARRHRVCPFELILDLSLWCDVIICDYNYLFDPQVYLRRFFSDGGDYIFLVDEAHNLADRAREMFSASISKQGFIDAKKFLGKKDKALRATLTKLNKLLLDKRRECEEEGAGLKTGKDPFNDLNSQLELFILEFSGWLGENPDPDQKLLETYFGALSYMRIAELYDERYAMIYETRPGGELSVKQFCADPSRLLDERLAQGRATVFFSATLTPAGYFKSVLGGGEDCKYIALSSPFPRENLLLLIADDISTKYKDRDSSLERVADMIYHTAEGKTGNFIAYFPSYSYLSAVYTLFCEKYPDVMTVRQKTGMAEDERDWFLALFEGGGDTMVAFCVLGGVFSEGIDLTGERLIGTIIVGVGLPQINTELDIVREQYGEQGQGFDFAYRFPGMNKVLQAAGRVIRSGEDRGVVLLIDSRFTSRQYIDLFPEHWRGWQKVRGVSELSEALSAFWQR